MAYTSDMFVAMQQADQEPCRGPRKSAQAILFQQPNTQPAAAIAMTNYMEQITADKVFVSPSDVVSVVCH